MKSIILRCVAIAVLGLPAVAQITTYPTNQLLTGQLTVNQPNGVPQLDANGLVPLPQTSYNFRPLADAAMVSQQASAVITTSNSPIFVLLGDSYTRGNGASTAANMWAQQFSSAVQAKFGSRSSFGIVQANPGQSTITSLQGNITYSGAWALGTTIGPSGATIGGTTQTTKIGTASSTASYVCSNAASFNVYYATSTDTTSGFTAQIDGAAGTVYGNATSGSPAWAVQNISAGTAGSHTLLLTSPASGSFYFWGVECLNGNTSGANVENIGISGAVSGNFAANTAVQLGFYPLLPGYSSKNVTTVFMVGTNDSAFSVPVATYKANALAVLQYAQTFGSVVIVSEPLVTRSDLTAYNTALVQIAQQLNVPLVSIADAWGSIANETALGLLSGDSLHPSDLGHKLIANQVYERTISRFSDNFVNPFYFGNVTLGTANTTASASPAYISLGTSTSSTAGVNPKFRLYDGGSGLLSWGIGISSNQMDIIIPTGGLATSTFAFWVNGSKIATLNRTAAGVNTLDLQATVSTTAGANPHVNMQSGYGFGTSNSGHNRLDYISPAAGGALSTHSFWVNGSEVAAIGATATTFSTSVSALVLQSTAQSADPGCTVVANIGKQWFDNTTTTTVYKVCMNVSGTVGWVTK